MSAETLPKRYHPLHVTLHWLTALLIFVPLMSGFLVLGRTPDAEEAQMLGMHRTVGVVLALVIVARTATRFIFKRPAPADAGHPLLNLAGKVAHFLLYVGAFGILFTGSALGNAYGLQDILAGNGTMPENLFVYPERAPHGNLAYVLIALVVLHVGAALYHQFIRKDNLMARMWYGK